MTFKAEYFTLSSTDTTTNKFVSLSGTPLDSTVALDVIGGTAQALSSDFVVDGTNVSWLGESLDGQLNDGDQLRILYDRS